MPEAAEPVKSNYGSFVRKAYIQPIRTVIVVDDDFPTFEAMLDKEASGKDKANWKTVDVKRAQEIIDFCRKEDRK